MLIIDTFRPLHARYTFRLHQRTHFENTKSSGVGQCLLLTSFVFLWIYPCLYLRGYFSPWTCPCRLYFYESTPVVFIFMNLPLSSVVYPWYFCDFFCGLKFLFSPWFSEVYPWYFYDFFCGVNFLFWPWLCRENSLLTMFFWVWFMFLSHVSTAKIET